MSYHAGLTLTKRGKAWALVWFDKAESHRLLNQYAKIGFRLRIFYGQSPDVED